MKKIIVVASLISAVLLLSAYSCGQNGPTPPSVTLAWAQAVPPSGSSVSFNCIYRSTGVATTPVPPALYCSSTPIVTYTDTTVARNTTYVYAVTASIPAAASGTYVESAYSGTVTTPIPSLPGNITPPIQKTPEEAKLSPFNLKATVHAGS